MTDENEKDTTSTDETQETDEKDESQDTDTSAEDQETEDEEEKDEEKDTESDDEETDDEKDEEVDIDDFEPETRTETEKKKDKEDEDDVDPDDAKTIEKVVDKKLSPLQAQIQKQNNEIEANSYISDNPEMAKHKPVILKYMAHPAYKNIPVKNIAAIVSSSDQQKIGAKKERVAAKKAADTKSKGTQARKPKGGKVDWLKAPKADYDKKLAEVKGMRR